MNVSIHQSGLGGDSQDWSTHFACKSLLGSQAPCGPPNPLDINLFTTTNTFSAGHVEISEMNIRCKGMRET